MADNGGTVKTRKGPAYVARPATLPYTPKPTPVTQHTRPFFRDPAHTRPTRWGLYRQLLRAMGGAAALSAARTASAVSSASSLPPRTESFSDPAEPTPSLDATPSPLPHTHPTIPASRVICGSSYFAAFQGTEHVKARKMPPTQAYDGFAPLAPLSGPFPHLLSSLRARWRTARGWTSMRDTRAFLLAEESLLSSLSSADPILSKREDVLRASYDAFLALPPPPPPPRPLLTGGYLRPSKFSPPLPRMKPQPQHIGAMYARRQRKHEQRILRLREMVDQRNDISQEVRLWRDLGLEDEWSNPLGLPHGDDKSGASWTRPLEAHAKNIQRLMYAGVKRAQAVYSPEVIERVKDARRRREVWRRNKARKARGEEPVFPERSDGQEMVRAVKRAEREEWLAKKKSP
ncbi:hypothetical protein CcaverHIS002_0408000 [Cutaneotrichosporon cavernicola]|nr:hypothetical protein CcaverHIS002_0408000 [Cutaneotrichosporon cavernicola]